MSPQQYREFEQMKMELQQTKQELQRIQNVTDPSFLAELQRRIAGSSIVVVDGASTTGTTIAVRNASDTASETVADDYAGVADLYVNGTLLGRIGYY